MILRKPYAFLIRHFRGIHFVLSILIGYIIARTNNLLRFIIEYIRNGYYSRSISLINEYTDIYLFLVIILIIAITITIYLLMRFKNKPRLFYLVTIITYVASLVILGRAYSNLQVMQHMTIDPRVIRLTRDIVMIFSFMQYFVIANTLLTMTGFNIKKFNFQADLEELNIAAADAEEFEFVLGIDFEDIKIGLQKRLRNAKFIFIENKYVILTLVILGAIIISIFGIINTQILNKTYREDQIFKTSRYELKVTDTYITRKDYHGNIIKNNFNNVIVKLKIKNLTNQPHSLLSNYIVLTMEDDNYYFRTISPSLFKDLGNVYIQQTLLPNQENTFILIYEVGDIKAIKDIGLRVTAGYANNNIKYRRVRLEPQLLDEGTKIVMEKKLNEELIFNESILKQTKLKITNYEIKDKFIYEYQLCITEKCHDMADYILANTLTRYDKTLLKLDLQFELDNTINSVVPKNAYELIETFGTIRYYKDDKWFSHEVTINNMTPKYYDGNSIFIDVLKEIEKATKINIIFNIRNKQYIYTIKE